MCIGADANVALGLELRAADSHAAPYLLVPLPVVTVVEEVVTLLLSSASLSPYIAIWFITLSMVAPLRFWIDLDELELRPASSWRLFTALATLCVLGRTR